MKRFLLLCFLFCTVNVQAQDYMDKIAQESCDCIDKISDTIVGDNLMMQLGLCMINAAQPYKKQLKKDYNINYDNIGKEGEKLGQVIGLRMAGICPNSILKFSEYANNKKGKSVGAELDYEGEVTRVDKDAFVVFTVKNEDGKLLKFYWLGFIEADGNIISEYKYLVGKNVSITYKSEEMFDPKLNEYRQFNIIKEIEVAK